MIFNHLNPDQPSDIPFSLQGDAYSLHWSSSASPDIRGLPSQDYTIYLFNTVKFHLGQTFRLFNEEEFMHHTQEFYDNASEKATKSRVWFVQFLLMLAFGKAFLLKSTTTPTEPPGASYFVRAMSSIPDMLTLWEDPILAVETFALISLYLYSIDMRESAYLYVSHRTSAV
jgi:proline utilization trans-activator